MLGRCEVSVYATWLKSTWCPHYCKRFVPVGLFPGCVSENAKTSRKGKIKSFWLLFFLISILKLHALHWEMGCPGRFFWHFYLLCIILLQVSPHRLNHLHFVNMFVEHDHVFSKFNWVGREIGEAKECFLEKMESMDLTMLTCLHTPPRFVLKRLEDPRIKNLKIDADLLEA